MTTLKGKAQQTREDGCFEIELPEPVKGRFSFCLRLLTFLNSVI
jgi:hypothetical protein